MEDVSGTCDLIAPHEEKINPLKDELCCHFYFNIDIVVDIIALS